MAVHPHLPTTSQSRFLDVNVPVLIDPSHFPSPIVTINLIPKFIRVDLCITFFDARVFRSLS